MLRFYSVGSQGPVSQARNPAGQRRATCGRTRSVPVGLPPLLAPFPLNRRPTEPSLPENRSIAPKTRSRQPVHSRGAGLETRRFSGPTFLARTKGRSSPLANPFRYPAAHSLSQSDSAGAATELSGKSLRALLATAISNCPALPLPQQGANIHQKDSSHRLENARVWRKMVDSPVPGPPVRSPNAGKQTPCEPPPRPSDRASAFRSCETP